MFDINVFTFYTSLRFFRGKSKIKISNKYFCFRLDGEPTEMATFPRHKKNGNGNIPKSSNGKIPSQV